MLATLAAICAALAIGPSPALAKKVQYEGPVNIPRFPAGGHQYVPTIQLKVKFEGKVPKSVTLVKEFGIHGPCSNGKTFDGENKEATNKDFKVKNRRFSGTDTETVEGKGFTITGRIPRKGPITGTARIFFHLDEGADCDSGVVTWTASRTSRLSEESELR
jgi:hypothetical protein